VWTPDGTHLVLTRAQPDALAGTLVVHADQVGSPEKVLDVGHLVPGPVAFSGDGATLWLLLSDYGPDQLDFIGPAPALYRADWDSAGARFVGGSLQRLTDPEELPLAGAI